MKLRVGDISAVSLLVFLLLIFSSESYAVRKGGVKSLFGSYKRDKYTENEAKSTNLGFDLLLSSMMPVSPFVQSSDSGSTSTSSVREMQASLFFNFEANIFLTLNYNWQIFLTGGYYNYETRQQFNYGLGSGNETFVAFRYYTLNSFPALLGVKYRFSEGDVVPYIGLAGGANFYQRQFSFDFNTGVDTKSGMALTAQGVAGIDFYFLPNAGLKLEAAAYYIQFPGETLSGVGGLSNPSQNFSITGGTFFVRYASGIFVLF